MKRIPVFILLSLLLVNCYTQSNMIKLSDKIEITYKDILDLKLQILAAQMSCGSFKIIDMGKVEFPVSIKFNDQNKIEFEIEGDFDKDYSNDTRKEIMQESFKIVEVGIKELIRRDFPKLNFDSNNIIGFWYYTESYDPSAKWEENTFTWMKK